MSRIVQIACAGHDNNIGTQADFTLFALTDDGLIWWADNSTLRQVTPSPWTLVPAPTAPPAVEPIAAPPALIRKCSWCKKPLGEDEWVPLLLDGTFCSAECVDEAEKFPRPKGSRKP